MKFMQSKGILQHVKLICVDTIDHSKIPKYVQSVPLLNIAGQTRPLVGKAAFEWAERVTNSSAPIASNGQGGARECAFEPRNRVPQGMQQHSRQDVHQNAGQGTAAAQESPLEQMQEIEAWRESEWSSSTISDSYSFITECPGGICRNFESLQNTTTMSSAPVSTTVDPPARPSRNMNVTFTDRGAPSNDSTQKNSEELSKRLETMKMQRELF